MRHQPRLKRKVRSHRLKTSTVTEIDNAVSRDMMRWNCSKSWIIATALAAFYDIDIMKPYEVKPKVVKFRKRA